jgi:hypothetical protein
VVKRAAEAAAAAGLALLLYLALRQEAFYKIDGQLYLWLAMGGERSFPRHFLYMPVLGALHALLEPLGFTWFEAGRLLSALGTAAGVGFVFLATAELGLARRHGWWATALFATAPNVVFFATVVELHGHFLAWAGLCCWLMALLAVRPSLARAALLGAGVSVAFYAHATGVLLPAVLLPLLLTYGPDAPRPFRATLAPGAVVAAVLAAGVLGARHVARALGLTFDIDHSGRFLTDRAATNVGELWRWGATLWYEWVFPLAPLSVLALLGLRHGTTRAQTAWTYAAFVPYAVAAILLLGGEPEYGAYTAVFAWPLALLALRLWRWPGLLVVLALQLALAVGWVVRHDDREATRAYARGVRALLDGRPGALLLGGNLDMCAYLLHLTDLERLLLFDLARMPAPTLPQGTAVLDRELAARFARGVAVLLPKETEDLLTHGGVVVPSGSGLLAHLREAYRVEPVSAEGFVGYRVSPR